LFLHFILRRNMDRVVCLTFISGTSFWNEA